MNKSLLLLPALAIGVALAGCNRPENGDHVAQRDQTPTSRSMPPADTAQRNVTPGASPADSSVAQRAAQPVSDSKITAEVKSALAADSKLSAMKIDVDTKDGVVTLTGKAPDEKAKTHATQLAAGPRGVMRVENRLEVQPS